MTATKGAAQAAPRSEANEGLVEQTGIEYIEPPEREGKLIHTFTTWWGANVEFATITTGVLATAVFGLTFRQALVPIIIGNFLGALALATLSVYGARFHAPQLVQSRVGFGLHGNNLPSLLNTLAGISWFAVNSVLGAFALDRLFGFPLLLSVILLTIVQVAIAAFGYKVIHKTEFALMGILTVIFGLAAIFGFFDSHAHFGGSFNAKAAGPMGFSGAFIITMGIALSYCLGWLAFASDYTRKLPGTISRPKVFRNVWLSMFIAGSLFEALGAALGTFTFVGTPTDLMNGVLPHAVAIITLVGAVIGTVTANALNLYSGGMSFKVMTIPGLNRVNRTVLVMVFGIIGGIATYLLGRHNFYQHYQNFLFLLGYWVAPWFAIVLGDGLFGRINRSAMYERSSKVSAGLVCFVLAVIIEWPFMNQELYVGPFAKSHPTWGDITYYVGFAAAFVLYSVVLLVRRPSERSVATAD